ncbi:glycosyltransferase [Thermosynechococcaceae cyanobacterium BACA0444]|uniref:Glycosyltransferase n=1 Tax=Pseudocalidococcus azoricus BACA0444 TaxID=2918990 RepID=A0AAE4FTB2_9CYAN|nr:glycosyltransferase [Pseudocalidococcus azoricus]MDS3861157.1 glycosyltransferase [Pseudocalidococcus azoricus BACA0444]
MISVVMVVKNGEPYLSEAIDSIVTQTYPVDEIILIDGNSTDRTAIIAQSYDLVQYQLQREPGLAQAYNQGIESAEGEFIAFLSHDDRWLPQKLQLQIELMKREPNLGYTITNFCYFTESAPEDAYSFKPSLLKQELTGRIMETLVARKSVFKQVGLLSPSLAFANDVEWFIRAEQKNIPMKTIPQILLHKRVWSGNTATINAGVNSQELLNILRQHIQQKRLEKRND